MIGKQYPRDALKWHYFSHVIYSLSQCDSERLVSQNWTAVEGFDSEEVCAAGNVVSSVL
jgi:hypothetical protein